MNAFTEYGSKDAFELDDPRRFFSPEADYGVMWRVPGSWPLWRVSYVKDTGDVYAIEQAGAERVRLLGTVPADPVPDGDEERVTYYRTLDMILKGWADHEVSGMNLTWVASRLTAWEASGRKRPEEP